VGRFVDVNEEESECQLCERGLPESIPTFAIVELSTAAVVATSLPKPTMAVLRMGDLSEHIEFV